MLFFIFQSVDEIISKEKKYLGLTVDKIKKDAAEKDKDTKEPIYIKVPQWIEGEEKMVSTYKYKDEIKVNRDVDAFLEKQIEVNIDKVTFETLEEAEAKFKDGTKPLLMALHGSLFNIKEFNK